jgi:quinol monooxygenase YgiN
MPDVIVIATARSQPGKEKQLERALREVAHPTRAQPGCMRFSLYRSEDDPGVIVGVERWASKADHDRHLQGAHFQDLAAAMGNVVAGPPQILWYEIIDEV